MNNPTQKAQGFTLIEVVIALALSVVIAGFAYESLATASKSVEAGEAVIKRINALDRTWQILAQDLRHVLPPEEVNVNGIREIRQVFRGASLNGDTAEGKQMLLQLSRHGWLNPMQRLRSDLQQVMYRVEDGVLWRDYRPDRNLHDNDDGIYSEDLLHQELIAGVRSIELLFLSARLASTQGEGVLNGEDYSRNWDELWPPVIDDNQTTLPIAMLIRMELEEGIVSERLYEIAP